MIPLETQPPVATELAPTNVPTPPACSSCGRGDGSCGCGAGGAPTSRFVYAFGRIEVRIPNLSIEKEIAQVTRSKDTRSLTEQATLAAALKDAKNRYLARLVCWVLSVGGDPTYFIVPRDADDITLLLSCLREETNPADLDLLIGVAGPLSPPEMCNGLSLPMVTPDQVYPFDTPSLLRELNSDSKTAKPRSSAEALLWRIMKTGENVGLSDSHRALNYLAVRYDAIYTKVAEMNDADASLSNLRVRPSRGGAMRREVDVIFSFTDRKSETTSHHSVRVDVSGEFPFLVSRLSPYFEM